RHCCSFTSLLLWVLRLRTPRRQGWSSRLSCRCWGQRLNVSHQRVQLLFADLPLKNRHDRWALEPCNNLRLRVHNGLTNVVVIGSQRAPVIKLHGLAKKSRQAGTPALHVKTVTSRTSKLLEQLLSILRQRACNRATCHPGLIVGGIHHYYLTDHA